MKSPIVLVDRGDIVLFESLTDLERYVESPDLDVYRVYDAEGMVIDLRSRDSQPASGQSRLVEIQSVDPTRAESRVPRQFAEAELVRALSEFLKRIGRPTGSKDLEFLIKQVHAAVGWQ